MADKIKISDECSYKTYSVCESTADSRSRVEEDGESDGPAVFMCGKCKLPIGDSLSWAGSDDENNQIMLKRNYSRIISFFLCTILVITLFWSNILVLLLKIFRNITCSLITLV